jgi:hypothetical protein
MELGGPDINGLQMERYRGITSLTRSEEHRKA